MDAADSVLCSLLIPKFESFDHRVEFHPKCRKQGLLLISPEIRRLLALPKQEFAAN
jgi:hypothetical protein